MPDRLNRRTFVTRSLQATTAALAASAVAPLNVRVATANAPEDKVPATDALPIVDTHQHLTDVSRFRMAWMKDGGPLDKSFLMSDYLAAVKGQNVVKTVYMEVDVIPEQQDQEALYVLDLCRRPDNPMAAAVISGRPASEGFKTYIAKYKDNPCIKGVREILHEDRTPQGYCLDPQFVKSVQLLGDMGLSFDLCMRSGELADADKLVAQCPRTRFIVDHCGNMSVQETDAKKRGLWMDGMQALAQRDNVVCKISGIVASARPGWKPADLVPNMRFSMETFGPDRRMFAGDWPVCTLRATLAQWIGALKEIVREMGMSPADQRKLFHDNAVRFYGLKDKARS